MIIYFRLIITYQLISNSPMEITFRRTLSMNLLYTEHENERWVYV